MGYTCCNKGSGEVLDVQMGLLVFHSSDDLSVSSAEWTCSWCTIKKPRSCSEVIKQRFHISVEAEHSLQRQ